MSGKKSKHLFLKIYFAVVIVILAAMAVGLVWFSGWLADYESSNNTIVLDSVVNDIRAGNLSNIAAMAEPVKNGLDSEENFRDQLRELFSGKEVSYIKAFSYDRFTAPAFYIQANGERVFKIVLKKSENKTKYGFDLFEPDYCSDFRFGGESVAIYVPDTFKVYVNGVLLDDKNVTETNKTAEILKYGFTKNDSLTLKKYEVSGIPANASVKVLDEFGQEAEITGENGAYEVHFTQMNFLVPDGAELFVRGIKVGERYISGTDTVDNIPGLLGENAPAAGKYTAYCVDCLPSDAEFEMRTSDGKLLSPRQREDGVYTIGYVQYSVTAPSNATVSYCGTEFKPDCRWQTGDKTALEELSSIMVKYLPERPEDITYRFSFIEGCEPEEGTKAVLTNCLGQKIEMEYDAGTRHFSYDYHIEADTEKYSETAIELSKMYSKFITSDMSKSSFLKKLLKEQSIYGDMKDTPQDFYTGHKKYWFENERIENLRVYSEDCFVCEVLYDHYIADIKTNHDYKKCLETHTKFWYVRVDGEWYLADWSLIV